VTADSGIAVLIKYQLSLDGVRYIVYARKLLKRGELSLVKEA
jgi:hypothetical protein